MQLREVEDLPIQKLLKGGCQVQKAGQVRLLLPDKRPWSGSGYPQSGSGWDQGGQITNVAHSLMCRAPGNILSYAYIRLSAWPRSSAGGGSQTPVSPSAQRWRGAETAGGRDHRHPGGLIPWCDLYQCAGKTAINENERNGRNGGTFLCIISACSVFSVAMITNRYYLFELPLPVILIPMASQWHASAKCRFLHVCFYTPLYGITPSDSSPARQTIPHRYSYHGS